MTKKYSLAVVIGRFGPMHNEHINLFKKGLELADQVLVLLGGAERPETIKNPINEVGRSDLIYEWARNHNVRGHIMVDGVRDYTYSDTAWVTEVQQLVHKAYFNDIDGTHQDIPMNHNKICIVGCEKDSSSYYLKMFPQWDLFSVPLGDTLDATEVRRLLFEGKSLSYIAGAVPEETLRYLTDFRKTEKYAQLVREYNFIKKYHEDWAAAPYDPMFVTTDAWVVQSGHVLLIQRKHEPGYGLWAAPGGFLKKNLTVQDNMLCELREETKLKVPTPVLEGSIIDTHVFDDPNRSLRGRTVTHSFLIKLKDGPLPKIKGSDDAMDAKFIPFHEVTSRNMFEDHYDQWKYFKNKI